MIKVSEPTIGIEETKIACDVLNSKQYVNGKYTKQFEQNFAKYCETDYCVSTSNGTAALHLALLASNVKPNDYVMVPAIGFFATVEAVMHAGAIPVFVDVNPMTWCISYDSIQNMTSKFDKIKAVIAVHLFGQPCHEINLIKRFAQATGINLIEDCAQAHGATVDNHMHEKVGSFGHYSCFSFMATKNMHCGGEGGAIVSSKKIGIEKIKKLRSHGMSDYHTHSILGYNYKMSEMECAIADQQLKKLDKLNEIRRNNSYFLRKSLQDILFLEAQYEPKGTKNVFFWCGFKINTDYLGYSVNTLREKLKEKGIETRYRYDIANYRQPALKGYFGKNFEEFVTVCPDAERIAGKLIGLPNHPGLSKEDLNTIVKAVREIDKR